MGVHPAAFGKAGAGAKTALVLSAGGMFGSYQAGVWAALSSEFQPDIVVGASIGSLNGWLIAAGVPAREIEDRWMNLEDAADHRFQWPRRLTDGILHGDKVETWIRDIFGSVQPTCEYGLVATEMKTLKPRLFQWPDLEWTHLAASCAVPLFLKQHRIDGTLYADGGLVDPLPVWAAIAMGATRIVTVNVLVHRPAVVKAAAWVAGRVGSYRQPHLEGIEVVNIVPSESIGELRDSMYWTQANAERLLRMGRRDAEHRKHLVVECLNRN